ncbi:non-specific lipid-transfer protein A-like [Vicia villosa]|uniref:non-specific lipid-transfer protein A-like n=1 Tax=Vicia villosa TaxID=3911 RepID=UPI00273CC342|nr:non-specific lipid-transfer protein A-like [Vicia villosa]XP_058734702.1 non-specific lipid-transfer protein A-like [Vicia villosa]XP_058734709.1 non-specific lipid-transfer protein A-like [Vicia villosa]XP_058734722.1 non-specific lipid-transfer protein A-like [Vicia villosa]XP_058734731.1 non-specific lipid-transfer protein A-like [Vicia villosa]XP_058752212.1 non-specific lipid-transfer protein A-like [Vicia villosa]
MKNLSLILIFLVLLLLNTEQGNALDCGQVQSSVHPCEAYLLKGANEPSAGCCSGVRSIRDSATTVEERRAACECLEKFANKYPNVRDDLIASVPVRCGVDLGYPISKAMNCNDIP